MIAGAIFDVDGTLLDSMPIWDEAGALYIRGLGKEPEPGLGALLYPMSMSEGADYLKSCYRLRQSREEIVRGVTDVIRDFYLYRAQFKPGVESFLFELVSRRIPMAVATSGDQSLVEGALCRLGVRECFAGIFTCAQAGAGKSQPDVYRLAAQALGAGSAADIWVFEDACFAARTAKAAGFKVAVVQDASAAADRGELLALADIYMEDFTDFNGFFQRALK